MFKIEGKTIKINRGDKGVIGLTIPGYQFQVGDIVTIGVYEKKGLERNSKLFKSIEVETTCDELEIKLTKEDTSIDEIVNKPITYWYEIELNNETTIVGYDEEGPAEFILYPEGSDIV